jgi:hypothetical protein
VAAHDVWVCAPANAGATGQPGDACTFNSDCASDNCIGFSSKLCRPPCSNSASCKTVAGFASGHCLYGSSGPDEFKFCYATTSTSASAAGAPCLDSSTCQSDYCDGELKTCANVCGRDADCAVNEKCRPSATGIPLLRCVPAP